MWWLKFLDKKEYLCWYDRFSWLDFVYRILIYPKYRSILSNYWALLWNIMIDFFLSKKNNHWNQGHERWSGLNN